jgi:hypothetical protein
MSIIDHLTDVELRRVGAAIARMLTWRSNEGDSRMLAQFAAKVNPGAIRRAAQRVSKAKQGGGQ